MHDNPQVATLIRRILDCGFVPISRRHNGGWEARAYSRRTSDRDIVVEGSTEADALAQLWELVEKACDRTAGAA